MVILKIWLIFSLCTIPYNEKYNYENPTPFPSSKYVLLNWERDDFRYFSFTSRYVLKDYRKSDNKYKAKARRDWYERQTKRIR